jgi:predicted RND superfamily exporter protein
MLNPFSVSEVDTFLTRYLRLLEAVCFRFRATILVALMLFTALMGYYALQLRMDAGFEKQMPIGHEYIQTFNTYREDVLGANRLNFVVKARSGDIWTQAGLERLYEVTQAVSFLPNVDRLGVQSLWTPNSFVNEITEEGFRADPLISGTIMPRDLTPEVIAGIQRAASQGGFIGTLVARDQTSAMIVAELHERDRDGKHARLRRLQPPPRGAAREVRGRRSSRSRSSASPSRSATSPTAPRRCSSSARSRCC